ncbi:MAG: GNAT family N-acetyltransferase, partial [Cyanobacteria bacterium REEB65]|nr:GNAT family N-acetyltransferase [Cyanobacteria bacterium REEB65]
VGAIGFSFDDGTVALLGLAYAKVYRGLLTAVRCGVAGGYGGLIAPQPLSWRHVAAAFEGLASRFCEWQGQSMPHVAWPTLPLGESRTQTATLLLPLAELATLRRAYNENRRRDARKAVAYDRLTIENPALKDLLPFYSLYQEAADQWHYTKHRHGAAFWNAVFRGLGPSLALTIASREGRPAAARLVALRNGIAYDLAFSVHPLHRGQQAATAVTEAALEHAYMAGARVFDFMPSGSLEGVWRFKASFGAKAVPVFELHQRRGLARILQGMRAMRASR